MHEHSRVCKSSHHAVLQEAWMKKQRAALAAAVTAADANRGATSTAASPATAEASTDAVDTEAEAADTTVATAATGAPADPASGSGSGTNGGAEAKERKAELDARVKLLEGHADAYADSGPMVHVVAWHDGDCWRAALDTSELFAGIEGCEGEGKLADFTPMTNFRCAAAALLVYVVEWLSASCATRAGPCMVGRVIVATD